MKALDYLEKLLVFVAAVCLTLFCIATFAEVIARFVFSAPLVWSEEAARIVFIYMVFIGCSVGVRRSLHYSFDVFAKVKNPMLHKALGIAALLLQLVFFGFLLSTGLMFLPQMQAKTSSILRIPISTSYAAIIMFAAFGVIFTLEKIVLNFRKEDK